MSTSKTRRLVALLVAASPGLAARCREAAGRAGTILREAAVAGAAATAAEWRPVVIILTEAIYADHAKDIDVIAASVKATLLRLANEEAGQDEIDGRLRAIIDELGR